MVLNFIENTATVSYTMRLQLYIEFAILFSVHYSSFLFMTIRLIGIRQFAQNLSKLLQEAQEKNVHFVVMRHGVPIANVTPAQHAITEEDLEAEGIDVEELKRDIAEAREQIKRGDVYSIEEAAKELGIKL